MSRPRKFPLTRAAGPPKPLYDEGDPEMVELATTVFDAIDSHQAPEVIMDASLPLQGISDNWLAPAPVAQRSPVAASKPAELHYQWRIESPVHAGYYRYFTARAADEIAAKEMVFACDLSSTERLHVTHEPPRIIRDTQDITLSHDEALDRNATLEATAQAVERANQILQDCGIDPDQPMTWVQEQTDDSYRVCQLVREECDAKLAKIGAMAVGAIRALTVVGQETGVIELPAAPAPAPDLSSVTVIAESSYLETIAPLFPGALVIARGVEDVSDDDLEALAMTHKALDDVLQMMPLSDRERGQIQRVKLLMGVKIGSAV